MSDFFLAVDTGGSQTKLIYQLHSHDRPQAFTMPPDIEQISPERLQQYFDRQGWIGNPSPHQRAWVEWNQQVFILGEFAAHFQPEDRLKERKYENTLYKVLAAIGIILAQHSDFKNRRTLHLSLAVLLPWNEYGDRTAFTEQLTLMLQDYKFQHKSIKVKLDQLLCRPEGGGLAASLIRQHGLDWLRQQRLGVLMLGHRNLTSLYFHYGELQAGDSPLLGFSSLLDRIIELVGGLERSALAATLSQAMVDPPFQQDFPGDGWKKLLVSFPDWHTLAALQPLAFSKDSTLRTKEVEKLAQAIQQAEQEYWLRLERWLLRVLPHSLNLDQVLLGGGAFPFLRPRLEQHFNSCLHVLNSPVPGDHSYRRRDKPPQPHFVPLNPYPELQTMVETRLQFSPRDPLSPALILRFVDCFGLFDYLIAP
jgi:hypothetical protein